jgi:hypothetical protein
MAGMHRMIYEESSAFTFILVTCLLGGWAAWMTGRAVAKAWQPAWRCILYLLILACVVRFLHYALFKGTLISPHYYIVDAVILEVIGLAGWRYNRVRQMTTQYSWLYERSSPFGWRQKQQVHAADSSVTRA